MGVLHGLGDYLRITLQQVPLGIVRWLFVAVPLVLMIWILRLPTEITLPERSTGRWDENLKLWAWLALAIQVVIYCLF
ncbi:MAG: hypothetical protein KatS3mg113_1008 [Planctomycetaceae bacterium]|nr:MAG: hypothetical protein KatS3mg113_1008 [Planctomycetaceae bacterium]